MVFDASIHGIDLNKVSGKKSVSAKSSAIPEFKSPEEYGDMTIDERKELTQRMMGKHKLKFG